MALNSICNKYFYEALNKLNDQNITIEDFKEYNNDEVDFILNVLGLNLNHYIAISNFIICGQDFVNPSCHQDKNSRNYSDLYKVINKATGSVGGNAHFCAMYGELSSGSMQKIINVLKEQCSLSSDSAFLDIGAGLGKPNLHFALEANVRLSIDVEFIELRHKLAMINLRECIKNKVLNSSINVHFICSDISEAKSLDPFTHIYMYDVAFEPPLQKYIATIFNKR
jgi:hypothetical protein